MFSGQYLIVGFSYLESICSKIWYLSLSCVGNHRDASKTCSDNTVDAKNNQDAGVITINLFRCMEFLDTFNFQDELNIDFRGKWFGQIWFILF